MDIKSLNCEIRYKDKNIDSREPTEGELPLPEPWDISVAEWSELFLRTILDYTSEEIELELENIRRNGRAGSAQKKLKKLMADKIKPRFPQFSRFSSVSSSVYYRKEMIRPLVEECMQVRRIHHSEYAVCALGTLLIGCSVAQARNMGLMIEYWKEFPPFFPGD